MRLHLLGAALLTASALAMPSRVVQTASSAFDSVELRNGGKVILRHGPTPQVTLLRGSRDYTRITSHGGLLVVDRCKSRCPRGYELTVEIVTPHISRVSVRDGGTIESRGDFALQSEIAASVRSGGTIDIRTISVDRVSASVSEGGRIFTRPQASLFATVLNGGNITYWGSAHVQSSIDGGGVVVKGDADEADKPLSELISAQSSSPPVPPLPVIPPLPNPR